MKIPRHGRARAALTLAAALACGAVVMVGEGLGSDHQDTPEVELSPRMDINDVYAFPSPAGADRIVLAMTTSSPITPAEAASARFDPNLLYQIKVDNTGDAREDLVFQVTFEGSDADQRVVVRGPVAPASVGSRNTLVRAAPSLRGPVDTSLGSAAGMQVFAGIRDDPFFIDLEQFFRIVPDRRPSHGALSQLPATPSASSFRPAGQAVDYLRTFNALAIVIELPESQLTGGGTGRIGVWGTISR
ncbi:MAG TPA: DUF4331 family protein [Longimicrobium sp.]|jgi:hypothetical protein